MHHGKFGELDEHEVICTKVKDIVNIMFSYDRRGKANRNSKNTR